MSAKRFLLVLFAGYVALAGLGMALYKSSGYSTAYMKEHEREHQRYIEIVRNERYVAYEERPALHPPDARLQSDIAFAEEYASRPAFKAERHRIERYDLYFELLNTFLVLALILRFARKPLLDFLDNRIAEIRRKIESAAHNREAAAQRKAQAETQVREWEKEKHRIEEETEAVIHRSLIGIQNETDQALKDIDRDIEGRKQAAEQNTAATIKRELVNQAVDLLIEKYKTEATTEKLTKSVDDFVMLLERIQ